MRPFLIVLKLSAIYALLTRMAASAFSLMARSSRSISMRQDFKSLDALSSTRPFRICSWIDVLNSSQLSRFSSYQAMEMPAAFPLFKYCFILETAARARSTPSS